MLKSSVEVNVAVRLIVAVLALLASAYPQTRRPAPPKPSSSKPVAAKPAIARATERLTAVSITGSKIYTSADLLPLIDLKPGQPFNRAQAEAAREKLLATQLFGNVAYEYKTEDRNGVISVTLTYEVSDYAERFEVRFDRLTQPEADLRKLLREKVPLYREPLTPSPYLLDQVKAALAPLTGPVDTRITGDTGSSQFVLIYPAGAPPVVADVRFKGNQVLTEEELIFAMRTAAVGGEYRETLFRQYLDAGAVPLYEARGRIRVRFPKIEVTPEKRGLLVTTTVEEGESYNLADVIVSGIDNEQFKRNILRASNLKAGDLGNMEEVKKAEKAMQAVIKRAGFLDVTSKIERHIDDAKREVTIEMNFTPGEQYTFGRLTLRGLDILSEPQIKKMWGLDPGKPYNPEYPEAFLQRIKDQRMFDNLKETKATATPNRERYTVDVTLEFR